MSTPHVQTIDGNTAAVATAQAATNTAAEEAERARKAADAAATALASKIKVNVDTARQENTKQAPGPSNTIVDGELSIAQQRLSNVSSDPAEALAASQRQTLVLSGKVDEAHKAYADAATQGKAAADALTAAKAASAASDAAAASALAHERAATASYEAQVAKNHADTTAYIANLNQKHEDEFKQAHSEALSTQVKALNYAGGACLLIFLLGAGFGGFVGLKIVWPFGAAAPLLFGLAQIVAMTWFLWAVGGVLVAGGVIVGYWVYQHYKKGDLLAATQAKAASLNGVVQAVVPVLDKAYDTATQPIKDVLDEKVFTPLSQAMSPATQAVVHTVRAEQTAAAPVAAPATPVAAPATPPTT